MVGMGPCGTSLNSAKGQPWHGETALHGFSLYLEAAVIQCLIALRFYSELCQERRKCEYFEIGGMRLCESHSLELEFCNERDMHGRTARPDDDANVF